MVALLAEGVDRNTSTLPEHWTSFWSPSSRRAWIEIVQAKDILIKTTGRPPRGGRG